MKTDLNLLLECLKYQMDCPLSQKEALITIYSICQQNSEASEYLREIGGLGFINDLAKSSVHGMVKEAALFTLGMIIESNAHAQKYFVAVGGLDTLAQVLIKLMHDDSCLSRSSTKLAIVVTKTLDACIANDCCNLTDFHLLLILEENQCELLKNNGLSLMIQVLTETQDEELHKAATFVLQNCKQMTEQLALRVNEKSLRVKNGEEPEVDMRIRGRSQQNYWKKAKDILRRINLIEKEHDEISMFTKVE
ncbi:hypothetical protein ASZ78_013042 [Callipepla squamata]|uniref:Uncharacterized protein n=1 Tax=Callipepla squamata TaxID=9009 RepID=A0A226MSJ7_CALSU|nr:hypothetical protein ASZ78_013042 [Callipepla squamata]